jgi:hypothetical protein
MSEQCEFVVESRKKRGEPVPCGKPGFRRRISGPLASTSAVLCLRHAQLMAKQGFEVEPLDPVGATARRLVEATGIDTSEGLLPLFDSEEER